MILRKLSRRNFLALTRFVVIATLVVLHAGAMPSAAAPAWREGINAAIADLDARVSALEATVPLKVHGGIQNPVTNNQSQVTITFDGAGFTAPPVLSASAAVLTGGRAGMACKVDVLAISTSGAILLVLVPNQTTNWPDPLGEGTEVQISYMALGY